MHARHHGLPSAQRVDEGGGFRVQSQGCRAWVLGVYNTRGVGSLGGLGGWGGALGGLAGCGGAGQWKQGRHDTLT